MKEFDVVKFCDHLKDRTKEELRLSVTKQNLESLVHAARAIELSMLHDDVSAGIFDKEV